jgi:hypothetical protein
MFASGIVSPAAKEIQTTGIIRRNENAAADVRRRQHRSLRRSGHRVARLTACRCADFPSPAELFWWKCSPLYGIMVVLLRFCIHPEVADSKGCKAGNRFVAFFIARGSGGWPNSTTITTGVE